MPLTSGTLSKDEQSAIEGFPQDGEYILVEEEGCVVFGSTVPPDLTQSEYIGQLTTRYGHALIYCVTTKDSTLTEIVQAM